MSVAPPALITSKTLSPPLIQALTTQQQSPLTLQTPPEYKVRAHLNTRQQDNETPKLCPTTQKVPALSVLHTCSTILRSSSWACFAMGSQVLSALSDSAVFIEEDKRRIRGICQVHIDSRNVKWYGSKKSTIGIK